MTRRPGPAAALALLAVSFLGCSTRGEDRVPAGTPIVLISVDTLRSDRLPAYGYDGVSTPALDRLRADSILFEHAYSPVPLTLPSHASALTGLLPTDHGVRDNMGYRLRADGLPYLPRQLRELGYRTGAAVSSFVLRGASGLDEGFDFYDDGIVLVDAADAAGAQRPGDETLSRAVDWLRSVAGEPFLLFFHIYEPHAPHHPPEPYASRYASGYDGDVADADRIVGGLLAELRELGVYDSAVIVFFSDHGEHLGDHGFYEHGPLLYREVLQVPLLLKLPRSRSGGETVEHPAQLIDIAPTLLSLLGADPPAAMSGTSLLLEEPVKAPIYGETIYPRVHFGWSDLTSLIDYPYHFIKGPDPELYDLETDPAETTNLLQSRRQVVAEMRSRLEGLERAWQPPSEEDPETRRQLEALGYVGGGAVEPDGPLADPKSRLHLLELLGRASRQFAAADYPAAVASLRELLAQEPGMVQAWQKLGFALLELGRADEGLAALEEAVERSGGTPQVALAAANGFLRVGRLDEAEAHAAVAAGTQELALEILAQVAVLKGELVRAEQLLTEAVPQRGTRLGPLVTQAHLRLLQGRHREAIDLTREVEAEFGDRTDREKLRRLYFIRGKAYALQGESVEARRAFLQEIELTPTDLASYTNLAFLYALEDRGPDAGETLRRMVEANPEPGAYAAAVRTLQAMGDPGSASELLRRALRSWPESAELRGLAG